MTAFYKDTVYECDYGRCKDDEGNPIWPGYKESWDVDLTALEPRATAALLGSGREARVQSCSAVSRAPRWCQWYRERTASACRRPRERLARASAAPPLGSRTASLAPEPGRAQP